MKETVQKLKSNVNVLGNRSERMESMLRAIVGHLNIEVNEDELDKDFVDWLLMHFIYTHMHYVIIIRHKIRHHDIIRLFLFSNVSKNTKSVVKCNSFDILVDSFDKV